MRKPHLFQTDVERFMHLSFVFPDMKTQLLSKIKLTKIVPPKFIIRLKNFFSNLPMCELDLIVCFF